MEKQIDNKKEQVQEQQEMEKREHVQEQQEEVEKQEQVQEPEEKKKQVESEKQQYVQEPEEREQELEKEPEEPPNPPLKKAISPPREVELQHAKPSSPPKLPAPTPKLLPHKNSKPKSPPSDSPPKSSPSDSPPHELEDDYDYKKPPSKDPTTTSTTTTTAAAYSFETVSLEAGIASQEFNNQERSGGGSTGSRRTYVRNNLSILKRSNRDSMVKRALLASRIFGFVFSLVSFSVMAADRDRGWALDSFYRYKEFRYCMAVNVIAFVYSGFQGYDIAYQLASEKRKLRHYLRYYLDFLVDQILTYLLISASSSAAVRIDDWQSNWGKDEFPQMARASVALSFLAFVALGLSSLISGYIVFTLKSI